MKRLLIVAGWLTASLWLNAQHPITFFTKAEASTVKKDLARYPLLATSVKQIKTQVDKFTGRDIDVPVPKDPAGGYTHEQHKHNYMLMFNSGVLYNLTSDAKYAKLVKDMLLKYAALNPTLKNHPQATSSSPGHLFWQALNDANWLVYAGMAYDLVYSAIPASERKAIEDGAFRPEVEFITKDLPKWFDQVHNHGVWACAGVGIVGLATGNREYTDIALYGLNKDGSRGFLAQLNGLFSPDGYYTEGPYYARYAMLPFYIFANALQHGRPELKIFEYRERILQKALLAALQQTNLDGRFFPFNDAIKEKDFTTNELVTAIGIAWNVYGADKGLLAVANRQGQVLLNKGGAGIAAAIAAGKNIPDHYTYRSVQYRDGVKGDRGGISLLRAGTGSNQATLLFKYSSHGLSHGHFDRLGISLYDQGNEVLSDYGSARFVGVEQKYGGRYLPENDAYASQSIAHNTIVVDEVSHFNAKEKKAEEYDPRLLFSSIGENKSAQVVSARENNAYSDVQLVRTVYLLQLPDGKKMVADIFRTISASSHQYDLSFPCSGQIIHTSFPYSTATKKLETLGKKNGYQHLWKEAEASLKDTVAQFTFLNNRTYYTISTLATDSTQLFFTRSGANDPNFNLRREPAYIVRRKGSDATFFNVVEIHGRFDPVAEVSSVAYPSVGAMELLVDNERMTIAAIMVGKKKLVIAQSNGDTATGTKHGWQEIEWTGPYAVWYDGKQID